MILSKNEIQRLLKNGDLKIKPLHATNVGPASVDLTLGNTLRKFKPITKTLDPTNKKANEATTTSINLAKKYYELQPGELILGITQEKIHLPNYLCAWLQGKSSLARVGLAVHLTASFIQPGSKNHQVLEMVNLSARPIKLKKGMKICQVIFEQMYGEAEYKGHFQKQKEIYL
ncbi:MAG: dCTP deaminase [Candidatus Diapherotrites archaeon]|nr:dCTP deaminase [Candidatus Diapherotrites archaeon]